MNRAMILLIDLISAMLTPLAGPYRVVAYKFGGFGGIGLGLVTWAGVLAAYPYFVITFWEPYGLCENPFWGWGALIALRQAALCTALASLLVGAVCRV